MLSKHPLKLCALTGKLVDIEFDTVFNLQDKRLHVTMFQNVKRLIEAHWLRGCPLWGAPTGLSQNSPNNPFTAFMYSVRQIVALWRVDHNQWECTILTYLAWYRTVTCAGVGTTRSYWLLRTDAQVVEAAIEMLSKAAEYYLGYGGSWLPIGRGCDKWKEEDREMFRFKDPYAKVAYHNEHAVVHMVDLYRDEVDARLRVVLSDEYDEWETLPDTQEIPQDITL